MLHSAMQYKALYGFTVFAFQTLFQSICSVWKKPASATSNLAANVSMDQLHCCLC